MMVVVVVCGNKMWCVVVVCGNKMWCGQCGAVRVRVLVVAGSETGGECGRL